MPDEKRPFVHKDQGSTFIMMTPEGRKRYIEKVKAWALERGLEAPNFGADDDDWVATWSSQLSWISTTTGPNVDEEADEHWGPLEPDD